MTDLHLAADFLEGVFGINVPQVAVFHYPGLSHTKVCFQREHLTAEQYRAVAKACDARPLTQRHSETYDVEGKARTEAGVVVVTVWNALRTQPTKIEGDGVAALCS